MSSNKRKTAFEIIAAYFVNIYDNELYQKAKARKEAGNSPSITESYQECATCYIQAFRDRTKKPENSYYRKIIRDLLTYYQHWSSYTTVTLAEFIDTIVGHLTPYEKYINMDNIAKDRLLRDSLTSVATKFTLAVIHEHLGIIIDNRGAENRNVRALQDAFIKYFEIQRKHVFELFIEADAKPEDRRPAEGVSVAVVNKMKKLLKKTVEEKCNLQNKLANHGTNTKQVIDQLKEQIKMRDMEISEKDEQIAELESALIDMNKKMSEDTDKSLNNEETPSVDQKPPQGNFDDADVDDDADADASVNVDDANGDSQDNVSGITVTDLETDETLPVRNKKRPVISEDTQFDFLNF